MIIDVHSAEFFYNKENPTQVMSFNSYDRTKWGHLVVTEFPNGFPQIKDNQILYRLYKSDNRGYILTPNDDQPRTIKTWYTLEPGDLIYVVNYNGGSILRDLNTFKFDRKEEEGYFWKFYYYEEEERNKYPNQPLAYTRTFSIHYSSLNGTIKDGCYVKFFSDIDSVREEIIRYEKTFLNKIVGDFKNVVSKI